MVNQICVAIEATEALSCISGLIQAMNKAGARTLPIDTSDLVKVVTGEIDAKLVAVVLPSPALLRFFADEIEKFR